MGVSEREELMLVEAYGEKYDGCAGWGWAESEEAEKALEELEARNYIRGIKFDDNKWYSNEYGVPNLGSHLNQAVREVLIKNPAYCCYKDEKKKFKKLLRA